MKPSFMDTPACMDWPAPDSAYSQLRKLLMNPSWIHQSTQGEKCDFHLASKSMTCVIDFGGTSLCRVETLIQSEFP